LARLLLARTWSRRSRDLRVTKLRNFISIRASRIIFFASRSGTSLGLIFVRRWRGRLAFAWKRRRFVSRRWGDPHRTAGNLNLVRRPRIACQAGDRVPALFAFFSGPSSLTFLFAFIRPRSAIKNLGIVAAAPLAIDSSRSLRFGTIEAQPGTSTTAPSVTKDKALAAFFESCEDAIPLGFRHQAARTPAPAGAGAPHVPHDRQRRHCDFPAGARRPLRAGHQWRCRPERVPGECP
jgi:hypothetical protein